MQAQSLRVGDWRDHLSYKSTYDVCQLGNFIYVSTDLALFKYNILDKISKRGYDSLTSKERDFLFRHKDKK